MLAWSRKSKYPSNEMMPPNLGRLECKWGWVVKIPTNNRVRGSSQNANILAGRGSTSSAIALGTRTFKVQNFGKSLTPRVPKLLLFSDVFFMAYQIFIFLFLDVQYHENKIRCQTLSGGKYSKCCARMFLIARTHWNAHTVCVAISRGAKYVCKTHGIAI